MDFAKKIKELLVLKGITSAELAKAMEITPQYISDLLLGKRRWNETTMSKACKFLGMELILTSAEGSREEREGVVRY